MPTMRLTGLTFWRGRFLLLPIDGDGAGAGTSLSNGGGSSSGESGGGSSSSNNGVSSSEDDAKRPALSAAGPQAAIPSFQTRSVGLSWPAEARFFNSSSEIGPLRGGFQCSTTGLSWRSGSKLLFALLPSHICGIRA